ncbi:MAG: hypothetical protein MZW92_57380 [Comamonadaceae bacterium]|nr:hypothetical protein [Comamonadaceae bacterium]
MHRVGNRPFVGGRGRYQPLHLTIAADALQVTQRRLRLGRGARSGPQNVIEMQRRERRNGSRRRRRPGQGRDLLAVPCRCTGPARRPHAPRRDASRRRFDGWNPRHTCLPPAPATPDHTAASKKHAGSGEAGRRPRFSDGTRSRRNGGIDTTVRAHRARGHGGPAQRPRRPARPASVSPRASRLGCRDMPTTSPTRTAPGRSARACHAAVTRHGQHPAHLPTCDVWSCDSNHPRARDPSPPC